MLIKNGKQISNLFFLFFIFSLQSMENFKKLGGKWLMPSDSGPIVNSRDEWEKEVLWDSGSLARFGEFQVSYKGEGIRIDGGKFAELISTTAVLGFYHRQKYLFHTRCLLVQFDPIAAWNFLPSTVKKILQPLLPIAGYSIRGTINISASLKPPRSDTVAPTSHLVNIVYHGWVGELLNKYDNYKIDLPMGIFEPNGVEPYNMLEFDLPKDYAEKTRGGNPLPNSTAIIFDKLTPQTVYQHGGHSPDNAIFVISSGRNLVTLWSVAIYENKHALVAFNILVNNKDIEDLICKEVIANSNKIKDITLKDILTALYETVLPKIANLADKNALRNAIVVIRDLIGGTYPSVSKEPSLYKANGNELFLQRLQNLKKAFYQLQKTLI